MQSYALLFNYRNPGDRQDRLADNTKNIALLADRVMKLLYAPLSWRPKYFAKLVPGAFSFHKI